MFIQSNNEKLGPEFCMSFFILFVYGLIFTVFYKRISMTNWKKKKKRKEKKNGPDSLRSTRLSLFFPSPGQVLAERITE